jgi:DNA-binding transcriptional ArsR family regulator
MVDDAEQLDELFHALAHRARRHMVARLCERDRTVGELAEPLAMSLAAASKHVKVLERAGLVRQSVRGRQRLCHLDARQLLSASDWLRFHERLWLRRLDALEEALQRDPTTDERA